MADDTEGTPQAKDPKSLMGNISKNPDAPKAKNGRRITRELYDAMWEAWRDGDRKVSTLTKIFGLNPATSHRIVKLGLPTLGWPSLNERSKSWDGAKLQADSLAAAAAFQEVRSQWDISKSDNLKLAAFSKNSIAKAMQKCADAVGSMKFVKYRRVLDRNVTPHVWTTIETPMNGLEISEALKTLATAIKEIGLFEAFWLGGQPNQDGQPTNPFAGWNKLTPDQINYIATTGQLPPGVTDEMLWGSATKIVMPNPVKNN
jgi:hypothetical protein